MAARPRPTTERSCSRRISRGTRVAHMPILSRSAGALWPLPVVVIFEWPSRAWTVAGSRPRIASVANVWRRWWNGSGDSPAASRAALYRRCSAESSSVSPPGPQKTKSSGPVNRSRWLSRSSASRASSSHRSEQPPSAQPSIHPNDAMRAHPPDAEPDGMQAEDTLTGGRETGRDEIRVRAPMGPTIMQARPTLTTSRSGRDIPLDPNQWSNGMAIALIRSGCTNERHCGQETVTRTVEAELWRFT